MRGELIIRLPFALVPPNPLGRERFVREALEGDNPDYSANDTRELAARLYSANERLYEVIAADPALLKRLVLSRAGEAVQATLAESFAAESVADVLLAVVAELPEEDSARQFFEKAKGVEVLLEEYAAPVVDAVVFGGAAESDVALEVAEGSVNGKIPPTA